MPWSAQGNILAGPQVPESMGKAFEATQGELAEKMWAALKAGDEAGRRHARAAIGIHARGAQRRRPQH
jgi:uncharacterized Ntn-hydrolase superfamily protein